MSYRGKESKNAFSNCNKDFFNSLQDLKCPGID